MMKSLYAQYILEREDFEIIESEKGFATFQIKDGLCYIRDIFVKRELRDKRVAADMADQITLIAKERGCVELIGSVCPEARGATSSLKVLLAYGFKLKSSQNNLILFTKGI